MRHTVILSLFLWILCLVNQTPDGRCTAWRDSVDPTHEVVACEKEVAVIKNGKPAKEKIRKVRKLDRAKGEKLKTFWPDRAALEAL